MLYCESRQRSWGGEEAIWRSGRSREARIWGAAQIMAWSDSTDGRIFCFGECRFIPDRQLLLHRGVPIHVGARALDLLHALVRRPGDLVGKDELIRFAWPNIFVHEANLKVNIAALRRALPRGQPDLNYIATKAFLVPSHKKLRGTESGGFTADISSSTSIEMQLRVMKESETN